MDHPFKRIAQIVRNSAVTAISQLGSVEGDPHAWERVEYSPGQGGTQPRRIDRMMDESWKQSLADHDTGLPIRAIGEEDDDEVIADMPAGTFLANVDPLDGTSNHARIGLVSAMSLVVYLKTKTDLIYCGVSVIQIAKRRHWWADPSSTWCGELEQPVSADRLVVSSSPGRYQNRADWSVAGVGAAAGETRAFLNRLTDVGGIPTLTVGGTPLGPEVIGSELSAMVECKATTVFDSAHLMLAANTDAVVGTLDGSLIDPRELRNSFLRLVRAKDRVIQPYVLAKNEEIYEAIVGYAD